MVHAFVVKIPLTTDQDRKQITELLDNAGKAIKGKDREASTYYFYRPEDDSKDKSLYGFEIYASAKDAEEVHLQGKEFFALAKGVEDVKSTFELDFFNPAGGFLTNSSSNSKNINDPVGFIYWAEFITQPGKRGEFLELAKEISAVTEKNEPDTLTYLWLESTTNADRVCVFERYKTKESFSEIHSKSAALQKFIKDSSSLIKTFTTIPYVEAGAGFISDADVQ